MSAAQGSHNTEAESAGLFGEEFAETDRILSVEIEEGAGSGDADLEQERRVAAYDLAEEGRLRLSSADAVGPYRLRLAADRQSLNLTVLNDSEAVLETVSEPLGGLQEVVEDYVALCSDYRDAVRRLAPSQIEKIDEARRESHREGAAALASLLQPALRMDALTARRFFTVLCAAVGARG